MREIDPNKCIDFILENAGKYAAAKRRVGPARNIQKQLKSNNDAKVR